MKKIVFGLQKGGVGKTTSVLCTGMALAQMGKKVLLVDCDPQANLTSSCQIDPDAAHYSTYDLFHEKKLGITETIVPTPWGFDIVPANINLASTEVNLASAFQRERVLLNKFRGLNGSAYDYVLTDSPPSLGLLTVNALAASDFVVMTVQCQLFAIRGLQAFMDVVELVQEINPDLRLMGVLLTMYDARTSISREVEAQVREVLGDVVFGSRIGDFTALANIPRNGPIQAWNPRHEGSLQYNVFAEEVTHRAES